MKGLLAAVTFFLLCVFFVLISFISIFYWGNYVAYSIDEKSLFFGRPFGISSNNGTSKLPQIAVQGSNVYVVWQDNTTGNYDIFFTHSSDNGSSFAPVRNLSNNNGTSQLLKLLLRAAKYMWYGRIIQLETMISFLLTVLIMVAALRLFIT